MTITFSIAERRHDQAIRALLQLPVDGSVRVAMTREPSAFYGDQAEGIRKTTMIAEDGHGTVLGLGARAVRQVYIDGRLVDLGYLHQFRRSDTRLTLRRLRRGFQALCKTRREDEWPTDYTTITADNLEARRLLEKGLPGLPQYLPEAPLQTYIIAAGRHRPRATDKAVHVDTGNQLYQAELQRLIDGWQCNHDLASPWLPDNPLYPRIGDFVLGKSHDALQYCCALWDQRAFRQLQIAGYRRGVGHTRFVTNLILYARRMPLLPAAPVVLRLGYLSFMCGRMNDTELIALLRHACQTAIGRGLDYLALTLPKEHSFEQTVRRVFRPYIYSSILYSVHWDNQRPVCRQFGNRPLFPEGGLL